MRVHGLTRPHDGQHEWIAGPRTVTFTECVHSTSRQPREVGVHIRERTSSPRTGTSSLCVVSSNTLTSKQGTVAYLARVPVLTSTQSVDGLFLRTSTIRLTVLSGVSRDGAQTNHLTTGWVSCHLSGPTHTWAACGPCSHRACLFGFVRTVRVV
ncbi:unnamed protein product [Vitrella brassicaformis CCMP3155]|uniref:Uncharacterized protein n=1 Tax=Vitrella brassicaformis (strain CCMP3155) TaxID=1169540 RepID=A0A0G4G633_VITBC|nr:unnamed protein product [Vitrella brassicaformis CCMP3155]|eukprot:CEM23974.1 unnamed protein product [Vitrella brassicaformis CCMP3155]